MAKSLQTVQPGNSNVQLDFVTLALFAGNDYLPRLRTVKLADLWNLYAAR